MIPKPFFSIIIPTLNEEVFLPRLLKNLEAQKNKNFEVIIVDGNSDDGTKKAVESFNNRFPVRFFQTSERNVSLQRNIGAQKALGTYLFFLDADSKISSSCFTHLERLIQKNPFLIILPNIIPQSSKQYDIVLFRLANAFIELSQIVGKPVPTAGAMIFQRDFFLFMKGYDEKSTFGEDHEIILRALKNGVRATYAPKVKVFFSLRRMERDGRIQIIRKYVISSIQFITKGKIEKNLFPYEMGGHLYIEKKKKITKSISQKYLQDITYFLKKTFLED